MFSIIVPMDTNRIEQFTVTKRVYDEMPQVKEFIIPTRSFDELKKALEDNDLMKDVTLIPYEVKVGFNPSKAFNIGVRNAKYDHIIITSPEVKPQEDLLEKFEKDIDKNIICQAWDEAEDGRLTALVTSGYRHESPYMYFLAMFQKKDIEAINGWDEEFMKGYAYEDNDFGDRWNRAGLPFEVRDDISVLHQYHPRGETIRGGLAINMQHYHDNTDNGVVRPENGLMIK